MGEFCFSLKVMAQEVLPTVRAVNYAAPAGAFHIMLYVKGSPAVVQCTTCTAVRGSPIGLKPHRPPCQIILPICEWVSVTHYMNSGYVRRVCF